MRKETMELIREAVAMADNSCQAFNINMEDYFGTTDTDKVAESLYKDVLALSEENAGYTKAIRFDGKKAIVSALKLEVVKPEYDYLNR